MSILTNPNVICLCQKFSPCRKFNLGHDNVACHSSFLPPCGMSVEAMMPDDLKKGLCRHVKFQGLKAMLWTVNIASPRGVSPNMLLMLLSLIE